MTLIRVPASTANLGPGFDALGMALDLYAEFAVDEDRRPPGAERVDHHHPAWVAFDAAGGKGDLWVRSPIPVGRGLGFSGTMRIGGAVAALAQQSDRGPFGDHLEEALGVAAALEGHADNAAASLYGGIVATDGSRAVRLETPLRPDVVVWIPEQTTSTAASRTALPAAVPFADAVFNVGRTALLMAALAAGDIALLQTATEDRLHQDARLKSAPASRAALTRGLAAGAWCGWLSGSGPTIALLTTAGDGARLAAELPAHGHSKVVHIDQGGASLVA